MSGEACTPMPASLSAFRRPSLSSDPCPGLGRFNIGCDSATCAGMRPGWLKPSVQNVHYVAGSWANSRSPNSGPVTNQCHNQPDYATTNQSATTKPTIRLEPMHAFGAILDHCFLQASLLEACCTKAGRLLCDCLGARVVATTTSQRDGWANHDHSYPEAKNPEEGSSPRAPSNCPRGLPLFH